MTTIDDRTPMTLIDLHMDPELFRPNVIYIMGWWLESAALGLFSEVDCELAPLQGRRLPSWQRVQAGGAGRTLTRLS